MRDIITEMRDIIRREIRARDTIRRLSSSRTVPYPHAQNELEQSEAEREWQSQEVNAGDGEQLRVILRQFIFRKEMRKMLNIETFQI
jgi:hypothetical protein